MVARLDRSTEPRVRGRHLVHADDRLSGERQLPGVRRVRPAERATLAFNHVGAGYFRTMATRILAGREFEPGERRRDVCVLNEGAARTLFPGQPALERYVRTPATRARHRPRGQRRPRTAPAVTCRVVGIAADAKFGSSREEPPMTIYFPLTTDLATATSCSC